VVTIVTALSLGLCSNILLSDAAGTSPRIPPETFPCTGMHFGAGTRRFEAVNFSDQFRLMNLPSSSLRERL